MFDAELKRWFAAHEAEMIADVAALVAIDSTRGEEKPGMPFGEGPCKALKKAEEIIAPTGMKVTNYDHYVVTADLNDLPRKLDILAHLDVVPAGNGWTVTEPFVLKAQDGCIYGRGTADDKGPAMCALYAMRAIRELNLPVKHGVRLILGSDEECGSGDIEYYFQKESSAPMSFSPDADFPLINIEKGGLHSGFTAEIPLSETLPRICEFDGGVKINVVPDRAMAVVEGMRLEALQAACGEGFRCEEADGRITITAFGKTAHASTPCEGVNAVTLLVRLLASLNIGGSDEMAKVAALFPHGDFCGEALGVNLEDAVSGKTTLTLDILSYKDGKLSGMFDCRASVAANKENTQEVIYAKIREAGFAPIEKYQMYPPHHVQEDSELVQGLLAAYTHVTGREARPIAIGGGTYVHEIENGVAFGCAEAGVDNRMHGPDEFMRIDQMLRSCEIFAQAILNLCS